jgi:hypothetical protein
MSWNVTERPELKATICFAGGRWLGLLQVHDAKCLLLAYPAGA